MYSQKHFILKAATIFFMSLKGLYNVGIFKVYFESRGKNSLISRHAYEIAKKLEGILKRLVIYSNQTIC